MNRLISGTLMSLLLLRGTGTGTAFTQGSVVFAGASGLYSQNNANLFWDNPNSRLGIGTAAPSVPLHVKADLASLPAFQLESSTANDSNEAFRIFASSGTNTKRMTLTATGLLSGYDSASSGTARYQLSTTGNSFVNVSGGNFGIGTASPASRLHVQGSLTSASWGTSGIQFQAAAATYTDSSAAGTRASGAAVSFAQPTFAASDPGTTITDAATVYIANSPTGGSNMTVTNPWALWVDAGYSRFDDSVMLGRTANSSLGNGNSNHNVNPGTASFLEINAGPTGNFTISGISGGVDGRILIIHNNTGQNMTLANEGSSSSAANRIKTMSGADLVTIGDGSAILIYSAGISRWIVLASQL